MKMMRPQIDESNGRKYNKTRRSKIPTPTWMQVRLVISLTICHAYRT